MKEKIRRRAKELGMEKCGFTDYDGKTAIVCLFPYFTGESAGNLSLYARSRDYHIVIKEKLRVLSSFIKTLSPDASFDIFADIGPLVDRKLAYRAGLGFYGKNSMLINPDFGSYFFIGYILTDILLESDSPLGTNCLSCNKCILACPGGALKEKFDISKCASHISQKKGALTKEEENILKKSKSVFGCDICQRVCPHNNISKTAMKEFSEDLIFSVTLEDIEALSNRAFMRKYKDRAFSWRGREVLVRNLHILDDFERE